MSSLFGDPPVASGTNPVAPAKYKAMVTPEVPNYVKTKDPDTYLGKYGAPINRKDYENEKQDGLNFPTFEQYADWVGSWAQNPSITAPQQIPPPPLPVIQLSDKAKGLSNTYSPGVNRTTKTPDVIPSTYR